MSQRILYIVLVIGLSFVALNAKAAPQAPEGIKNPDCICATTDDLRYVCGSDGKTYVNMSELECSVKCRRTVAEFFHDGQCAPNPEIADKTTTEGAPAGDETKGSNGVPMDIRKK